MTLIILDHASPEEEKKDFIEKMAKKKKKKEQLEVPSAWVYFRILPVANPVIVFAF